MIELTRDEWEKIKEVVFENVHVTLQPQNENDNIVILNDIKIDHESIDELAQNSGLIKIKKTALDKLQDFIYDNIIKDVNIPTYIKTHLPILIEATIKEAQEKNKCVTND